MKKVKPNIFLYYSLREFLVDTFNFLKSKNPSYSLRSFGRKLDVSYSSLSNYFSKNRDLKLESHTKIQLGLNLDRLESEYYTLLAQFENLRDDSGKKNLFKKIQIMSAVNWPDHPDVIKSYMDRLKFGDQFHYAMPGKLTFRTFARLIEKKSNLPTPHFVDRYVHSDLEVASTSYFFQNDNEKYRLYSVGGFLNKKQITFLVDENKNIEVNFDDQGFPEIKNFILMILQSELHMNGTVKFDHKQVRVTGYKYHPSNKSNILSTVDDCFERI